MKKIHKIYFTILIAVAISLILVFFYINRDTAEKITGNNPDSSWQAYRNEGLGFEIKYPKEVFDWESECRPENLREGNAVPVKIFEDDNAIYIDNEYSYRGKDDHCEIKYKDLQEVRENITWGIRVLNIPSEDSLNEFIKNNFGRGCYVAEKVPLDQEEVFMINVTGDDGVGLDTDCPINYAFVLNYFPEKNQAVYWELGQEQNFWGDQNGNITYDREMVESFRFIE